MFDYMILYRDLWNTIDLKLCIIDSFHIVSAHAPNSLVLRYLREITREGATFTRLPYTKQWNMEKSLKKNKSANKDYTNSKIKW